MVPHCVFPATIFSPGLEEENKQKHPVTHMLEEGDKGQSAEEVARASVRGLEKGQEMVSTEVLGALMKRGMLGSSRGRGVWDIVLGAVVNVVFGVVRWDMDGKVRRYGREKMPS